MIFTFSTTVDTDTRVTPDDIRPLSSVSVLSCHTCPVCLYCFPSLCHLHSCPLFSVGIEPHLGSQVTTMADYISEDKINQFKENSFEHFMMNEALTSFEEINKM